jgi:hypothetical protein
LEKTLELHLQLALINVINSDQTAFFSPLSTHETIYWAKHSKHDTIYLKLDFVLVRLFVFSDGKLGIAKEFVDMVKLLFQDARCCSHVPNQKRGETRLPIGSLPFLDYG